MEYKAIKTSPQDNVAIAVTVIPGGVTVIIPGDGEVVTNQEVPLGRWYLWGEKLRCSYVIGRLCQWRG